MHIVLCQHQSTKLAWKDLLEQLRFELEEIATDPLICDAITNNLYRWYKGKTVVLSGDLLVDTAICDQSFIGWYLCTCGRVSQYWRDAQQRRLDRLATRWKTTSMAWTRKLLKALMSFHWSIWEHQNMALHDANQLWKVEARKDRSEEIVQLFVKLTSESLPAQDKWLLKMPSYQPTLGYDDKQAQWIASAKQVLERQQRRARMLSLQSWSLGGNNT